MTSALLFSLYLSLSRFTLATFQTKKWWDSASWQGNTTLIIKRLLPLYASAVSAGWMHSSVIIVLWPGGLESEPAGHHLVSSSGRMTGTSLNTIRLEPWENPFRLVGLVVIITASFVSSFPLKNLTGSEPTDPGKTATELVLDSFWELCMVNDLQIKNLYSFEAPLVKDRCHSVFI